MNTRPANLDEPLPVTRIECPLLESAPEGTACACWGGCTRYTEMSFDRLRAEKQEAARQAVEGIINDWPQGLTHPSLIRQYLRERLARIESGAGFLF